MIALNAPPEDIRPGLSCTAKVTTATRNRVLSIPIQALTVRQKGDLEAPRRTARTTKASARSGRGEGAQGRDCKACSWSSGEKAEFRKVETGITGSTDIEVLSGLKEGDQIITGSYKVSVRCGTTQRSR